jgi:hypothetical protein
MLNVLATLLMGHFDTPNINETGVEERVKSILQTKEGQSIVMDAATFVPAVTKSLSLHQSLALRNRMIPESGLLRDHLRSVRRNYVDEQWVLEVETWFMKAILDALFRAKVGAQFSFDEGITPFFMDILGPNIMTDWSTCGRVLMRNANYTNINFIGFCSVFGTVLVLCLASYRIKHIFTAGQTIITAIHHPQRPFTRVKTSLAEWIDKVRLQRRTMFSVCSYFQPDEWFSFVSSRPHTRTARTRTATGPGRGQGVPVNSQSDPQQGMDDIYMDDIDAANLRRGEEIDDPIGSS